eukprot:CAMPEP_0184680240 /NCGR_PEP_ID=MMETSP0312-20130426/3109_1 /TAXON_ID=31354 /ORGANISM="Compsopogon coeruleus, Strain SAG 36.94" /LENGTH=397 /DNA_ID=CAMNT_0027130217 /DNA_START=720 /DNA_END=1913 /DNA_ORIENTATION=+
MTLRNGSTLETLPGVSLVMSIQPAQSDATCAEGMGRIDIERVGGEFQFSLVRGPFPTPTPCPTLPPLLPSTSSFTVPSVVGLDLVVEYIWCYDRAYTSYLDVFTAYENPSYCCREKYPPYVDQDYDSGYDGHDGRHYTSVVHVGESFANGEWTDSVSTRLCAYWIIGGGLADLRVVLRNSSSSEEIPGTSILTTIQPTDDISVCATGLAELNVQRDSSGFVFSLTPGSFPTPTPCSRLPPLTNLSSSFSIPSVVGLDLIVEYTWCPDRAFSDDLSVYTSFQSPSSCCDSMFPPYVDYDYGKNDGRHHASVVSIGQAFSDGVFQNNVSTRLCAYWSNGYGPADLRVSLRNSSTRSEVPGKEILASVVPGTPETGCPAGLGRLDVQQAGGQFVFSLTIF